MKNILEEFKSLCTWIQDEAIYRFDVFGLPPNLTVLKRDKFTSSLGFFISVILEILVVYYLVNEVTSMLSHSKPSIFQTEVQVTETNPYFLFNENFTLAISIADKFSQPIIGQNKYYVLNVSQCIRTRTKDLTYGSINVDLKCINLPIEPCNMSHFTTQVQKEYFSRSRFGAMQCINRKYLQEHPPKLQGQLNALVQGYISIKMDVCQNTTTYTGCASQEEISQILQAGHYVAYYSDYLSKLDSPGEVYQEIINYQFSRISLSTSKTISQIYRIIETKTDEGLIFEENQFQTNLEFKDWREIQDYYNDEFLITHYIMLDYKQTNNIRTYIKLQTVLAKIGGVIQILIVLSSFIVKPLIHNLMNFQIANSLFRLSEQSEFSQLHSQIIQTEQFSPRSDECITISNQMKNQNNKISFCGILSIIFGINKQKYKTFQKAKQKIKKNLDIITILRKLSDIDMMKKVIFTKEQQEIFKVLRKPLRTEPKQANEQLKNSQQGLFSNNFNSSSLQMQLKKAQMSQFSQNINLAISKSFIDEQLHTILDHQHQSQIVGKRSQEYEYPCDSIQVPQPQISK